MRLFFDWYATLLVPVMSVVVMIAYRFLFPPQTDDDPYPVSEIPPAHDPAVTGDDPRPVAGKWPAQRHSVPEARHGR